MSGHHIAYVALAVRDVDALARVFERQLGLRRADLDAGGGAVPVFSLGAVGIALFSPGHPYVGGQDRAGVHHIALAASDLSEAAAAAARAGIPTLGERPVASLGGGWRLALDLARTAGVATWLTTPLDLEPSHSLLVERVDHLGVASADNGAAIDAWNRRLGCEIESQQTDVELSLAVESFTSDKYGAVYHTRPAELVGGLRVVFITAGDCELEFLQNFDPRQSGRVEVGAAGTTRQDQGAIAKFVAGRGPGLHHLALKTGDVDAALAALGEAGVPLIDQRGRPGSRRARIGFVHPRGLGGILVHFVQRPT
jgi:methylmalonyl-CoA epimerase